MTRLLAVLAPLAAGPRSTLATALAVALLVALQVFLTPLTGDETIDSYSYYFAARALAAGADPYDTGTLQALAPDELGFVFPYLYPPVLAVLWRPLTLLDAHRAHELFVLVSLALAALNAALVWKLVRPAGRGPVEPHDRTEELGGVPWKRSAAGWLALFVLAHAVMGPLVSSVRLGQVNVLLGSLIFGALALERRDRPLLAGLCLGAAVLVKPFVPLVLLVDLVVRCRWRTLLATLGGGLAIAITTLPWCGVGAWLGFVARVQDPLPFSPPMSVRGLLDAVGASLGLSRAVLLGAFLVVVMVLVVRLVPRLRRAAREGDPVSSWGALVLFGLLAAPLTWHHHYYLALLAMSASVVRAFQTPPSRARWVLVALAVAMLLRYPGELHVMKPIAAFLALMIG